jgi:hypothetical protein
MTSAQKTAKEKFKKAIEYRNKTGVSLKEAFAHVYGRKVGAVKKAPSKKVSSPGKHTDTRSHNVNIKIVSGIGNIESSISNILGIRIGIKKLDNRDGIGLKLYDISNKDSIIVINSYDTANDIVNDIAPKFSKYIFKNTNEKGFTDKEIKTINKKIVDYLKGLLAETKRLNKSVKKAPAKKVAVKKAPAKKVARQSRSPRKVKATYKVDYQTGTSNRTDRGNNQDAKRKALPPGKRISQSGRTYYETRANRTDFSRSAMTGVGSKLSKAQEIKNLSTLGVGPLMKKVILILKNYAKDYNNLQDLFNDVLNNGLQSGMISELIYYKDTLAFYKKYQDEIVGLLKEAMYSSGIDSPEGLFGSKWDRTDPFAQGTNNKNLLTWFAFEETTRTLDNILH